MGYVIAAILVVLIVAASCSFWSPTRPRRATSPTRATPAADQNSLGIVGSDDESPAGDTSEHARENEARATEKDSAVPAARRAEVRTSPPAVDGGEAEGRRSTR